MDTNKHPCQKAFYKNEGIKLWHLNSAKAFLGGIDIFIIYIVPNIKPVIVESTITILT